MHASTNHNHDNSENSKPQLRDRVDPVLTVPAQSSPESVPPEAPCNVQHPEQPAQPPVSELNPYATQFISFAVRSSTFDPDDDPLDDADFRDHEERVENLVADHQIWSKFCKSDDTGAPPPPCNCHALPRGACPETKAYAVDRISRGLAQTGLTPNMDGLREPLRFQNFPIENWKWALHGYFDAHEILQGLEFGWDVSFIEEPKPKDAKWNLQGASLFKDDVQIYVDQESKFGSLIGPFEQS